MLTNLAAIFLKWAQLFVEFLLVFPVILWVGVVAIPNDLLYLWLACMICLPLVGLLTGSILRNQKTWVYVLIVSVISTIVPIVFQTSPIAGVIVFLIGCVFIYRGIIHAGKVWAEVFTSSAMWVIGLPMYFVGYLFYTQVQILTPFTKIITWTGIVVIVLTIILSNREQLKNATLSKDANPIVARGLKSFNNLYIILILSIIVIMTNFNSIKDSILTTIGKGISWFLSLFNRDNPIERPPMDNGEMEIPPAPESDPSAWEMLLQDIFKWILTIALIVGIVIVLYYVYKDIKRIVQKLSSWLAKLSQIFGVTKEEKVNYQYIDEEESIFDWDDIRQNARYRAKDLLTKTFKRKPKWDKLSNQEKVRTVYREVVKQSIQKGYKFQSNLTPRETIQDIIRNNLTEKELAKLEESYGKARYSNEHIDDEMIKELYQLIESNR